MFNGWVTMEKPNLFLFEAGGHGDLQTLELKENGEVIVKFGRAKIPWFYDGEITLTPDTKRWSVFLTEIEELQVWNWKESYHRTDMCDGSHWELELSVGKKVVKSFGSGLFPENFEKFKHAIKELLA